MKKLLVTGGTVFVSKAVAAYFSEREYDVYVLNRGNKPQLPKVHWIKANRNALGNALKEMHFDAVLDITAYTKQDISDLLDGLGTFDDYIMISSSAVYPETNAQPFMENGVLGNNKFWGNYGTDKIEAEKELLSRVPNAYILRPPYLYGEGNNVYRESFVFDCAMQDRAFYLPKDGGMKMQFFHVKDLCRFIEILLQKKPEEHIYNVGNKETICIKDWVCLCYKVAKKEPRFVNVNEDLEQRNYFSFYDYEYYLDVSKQYELMNDVLPMSAGLKTAYQWYESNQDEVWKKPYIEFIKDRWEK